LLFSPKTDAQEKTKAGQIHPFFNEGIEYSLNCNDNNFVSSTSRRDTNSIQLEFNEDNWQNSLASDVDNAKGYSGWFKNPFSYIWDKMRSTCMHRSNVEETLLIPIDDDFSEIQIYLDKIKQDVEQFMLKENK